MSLCGAANAAACPAENAAQDWPMQSPLLGDEAAVLRPASALEDRLEDAVVASRVSGDPDGRPARARPRLEDAVVASRVSALDALVVQAADARVEAAVRIAAIGHISCG